MMAGVRFSTLNSFYTSVNHVSHMRFSRPCSSSMNFRKLTDRILPSQSCLSANHRYHRSFSSILGTKGDIHFRILPLQSVIDNQNYRNEPISGFSPKCLHNNGLSNLHSKTTTFPVGMSSFRAYSSFFGSEGDGPRESEVKVNHTDVVGSEWVDNLKNAWQSAVDAVASTGEKVKELSSELTPHVQQLVDSHPYVRNVIIPVCWTLTGTMLAWLVMPRVLRKLHKYSMQGTAALLPGNLLQEHVPYEKSFWGALEDPVRYLITFMAFSQLGVMIAPTTIASQYLGQAWRGAVIVSFVWFLHRWKTNVFVRNLTAQNVVGLDRERLLALDKLSSVGLFVLGLMALAEACGVAVQSILTVGGIGGVATAFAARDILGNVLSGLSMQFSKPFSLGDTIKAGSIEGQVVEMGLTTTSLLNAEKFPVIVPNSLFSSQVIVNKSRAQWRAMVTKIPLWIDNLEKIPEITEDIKTMLKSNPKIFLGKEAPYCFLSRIEKSFAELSVGCNLKYMSKEEFYSTEQDILLQVARIIKLHGAALGSTSQDLTYQ